MITASTHSKSKSRLLFIATVLLASAVTGCGDSTQLAEVEGVLFIAGKPGHKISIEFSPDRSAGSKGPISYAATDAQGRFKLEIRNKDGSDTPGAIIGKHLIVLHDIQMSESATGVGVPMRLKPEWQSIATTPLKQEVKPGKQTIELKY